MSYFVVERKLPGITADGLKGAGLRAKTCVEEMCREGSEVRWMRSFFLPEREETFCFFEAPTLELIKELNERAQIPYKSITEVQELTPEML